MPMRMIMSIMLTEVGRSVLFHVRVYIHQWPLWMEALPHSARPQLLSITNSYLQNQYHPGDSYKLSSLAASMRWSFGLPRLQLLCPAPEQMVPGIRSSVILNNSSLFVITSNFSALTKQLQCPSKAKASPQWC